MFENRQLLPSFLPEDRALTASGRSGESTPNLLESLPQFTFKSASHGVVVFAVDSQVLLGHDPVRVLVRVLVIISVAESRGSRVVTISQMSGHGLDPILLNVFQCRGDS